MSSSPCGPDLGKVLVGTPAHQHRVGRKQQAQPVPQIGFVTVFHESRGLPAENAVDGEKRVLDDFAHEIMSSMPSRRFGQAMADIFVLRSTASEPRTRNPRPRCGCSAVLSSPRAWNNPAAGV